MTATKEETISANTTTIPMAGTAWTSATENGLVRVAKLIAAACLEGKCCMQISQYEFTDAALAKIKASLRAAGYDVTGGDGKVLRFSWRTKK